MSYVKVGGLKVDSILRDFVEFELLPRLQLRTDVFWSEAEALLKIGKRMLDWI